MSEHDDEASAAPLSPWEELVASSLLVAGLPRWEHLARAATFVQGHRGLLDCDLDFPREYLKGPAPVCYVWKVVVGDGYRVHAYADIDGGRFHLQWEDEDGANPQNQPVHFEGACSETECEPCRAAAHLSEKLEIRASKPRTLG